MINKFVLFFVLLLYAGNLNAYDKSDTIYATDGTLSDVQAAITDASDGDTVSIPAGSYTWSSTLSISKNIILQGNGYDDTAVTTTSGAPISINGTGARVTRIHFINGKPSEVIVYLRGKNWRVDHCKFSTGAASYRWILEPTGITSNYGFPVGLIDNNKFEYVRILVYGAGSQTNANAVWAEDLDLGEDGYNGTVYIEDNEWLKGGEQSEPKNALDAGQAGHYVFRFNKVVNLYLEAHSLQAPAGSNSLRGARKWEIYGNNLSNTASIWTSMSIRAGSGVIFNNHISGGSYAAGVLMDNVRSCLGYPTSINDSVNGACDGDNILDGNLDANGWPCRDQIGTSKDLTTEQWPEQKLEPAYIFGNSDYSGDFSVEVKNSCSDWIIKDRDYYTDYNNSSGVLSGKKEEMEATSCTEGQGFWVTDEGEWADDTYTSPATGATHAGPDGQLYTCNSAGEWTLYYTPNPYPYAEPEPDDDDTDNDTNDDIADGNILVNKESGGCFIATAAFGSDLKPQVVILREFRDRFLIKNSMGRGLVNLYHACSPAVTGIIADHPSLRFSARVGLMPMVGSSYLALNLGLINTLFLMLILAVVATGLAGFIRKPIKPKKSNQIRYLFSDRH